MATAVQVSIYAPDGVTLLANIPRRRNVQWLNELNSAGSAQFDMPLDDPLMNVTGLLTFFNIVKFTLDGQGVKAWVIESVQPVQASQGEGGDRWITVTGRGIFSCLEAAVVYPENNTILQITQAGRNFNYASAPGEWYIDANWVSPTHDSQSADTFVQGYPNIDTAGVKFVWPDPDADWLWYPAGGGTELMPPGDAWFRTTWANTDPMDVKIYVTADNQLKSWYFDGQLMAASSGKEAFKTVYQVVLYDVPPGIHIIGAQCTNLANTAGTNNHAGYLMTAYQLYADGSRTDNMVFHTDNVSTVVTGYPDLISTIGKPVPGWRAATILKQLIIEAQQRDVTALLPITQFLFDINNDSAGAPWVDIQNISGSSSTASGIPIGSTDLSDIAEQLVELACDIDFDTDFNMQAWVRRGTDKSASIRLVPASNIIADTGQSQGQRIRNQALVLYNDGMIEMFAPLSKTQYGRREAGISAGSATLVSQAQNVGQAALLESAQPETTVTTTISSLAGPRPFIDFDLGDTVTMPAALPLVGYFSTPTTGRVMSIAGSEQGEGWIQYDIAYYPTVDDETIQTTAIPVETDEGSPTGGGTGGGGGNNGPTATQYSQLVTGNNAWGYWRLINQGGSSNVIPDHAILADSSGNNHNAEVFVLHSDNPTGAVDMPINTGVQWGNDNSDLSQFPPYQATYASTANGSTVDRVNSRVITLECWVKLLAFQTVQESALIGMVDAGGLSPAKTQFSLMIGASGHLIFKWTDQNGDIQKVTSDATFDLNVPHYVAASYGADGAKLYYDGVLDAGSANPAPGDIIKPLGDAGGNGYNVLIHASVYDYLPVKCVMSNVAVYRKQLQDSDITARWNVSLGNLSE